MAKNTLHIENFGPIKKANIDVKDMMVFIGPQSSGKSTLAKLITILNDFNFRQNNSIDLKDELKKYNIESFLKKSTKIVYKSYFFSYSYSSNSEIKLDYEGYFNNLKEINKSEEYKLKYFKILLDLMIMSIIFDDKMSILIRELFKDENFGLNVKLLQKEYLNQDSKLSDILDIYDRKPTLDELKKLFTPINNVFSFITPLDSMYIPAERTILPLISSNLAGLINNNISIPNHIIFATQEFEKAINNVKELNLDIIGNLKYKKKDGASFIYYNRNQKTLLKEASSGVQSILPIMLLIENSLTNENFINLNYVVEEPELNLYPEAQYKLIQYLVKNCLEVSQKEKSKNLIITTHSPYVLAAINNLLLSHTKGQINNDLVSSIINESSWVNPSNFNAYEVKNGKVNKIFNQKNKLIEETIIDDVSDIIMYDFKDLAAIND